MLNDTRPRRVNPESIVDLLRGTPPGMPSGVTPPQVQPMVRESANAPVSGGLPNKEKILDMIRGARAKEPLATSAPEGATVSPQPTEPTFEASQGNETRPWKVGHGVGETNPLKREAARIRAMQENPISEVNPDGSVKPPNPMSRKKAILMGLLNAGAQIRPGASTAEALAALGTGAAIGGISPRSIQKWQRRMEVEQAQGELNDRQKLEKQRSDIEEQQAQTNQRGAAPAIAAAELARKEAYDRERLKIQRDAAEGRISAADATRKLREAEMKQRADEGRLNRESRERIAARPTSTDASAAEGESLATSTGAAADELKRELDQNKGQLIENERAITQKEGVWNKAASKIVADSSGLIKLEDALKQAKAADPDVQSGTYDQTVTNTKALRDAVSDKEKRIAGMQEDVRKGSAKASRRPGRRSPETASFSIAAYLSRNKGATPADAREFAKKNYPNFEIVD